MALPHRMLFLPNDAAMVSEHLAVARQDGPVTFFDASGPICICDEHDEGSLRVAAAMLTNPVLGLATPSQMANILGRHRSRVHAYRKRYHDGGAQALDVKRRGPRGPNTCTGRMLARAQRWLNEGTSYRKVAAVVGVDEKTIRNAVQEGRLLRTKTATDDAPLAADEAPSTPRERSHADASCAGGVATTREAERALAPTGLLVEAWPRFDAAESVAKAGVLVALPALLGQGRLEVGQQLYGSLKHGYYGLTSMLLSFGLMALVRIKSTEGLTTYAPGEFGRVLGLDRAPEMTTARRKLAELAGRGRALECSRAFAERWATEAPDALGYLYIDGHVRP